MTPIANDPTGETSVVGASRQPADADTAGQAGDQQDSCSTAQPSDKPGGPVTADQTAEQHDADASGQPGADAGGQPGDSHNPDASSQPGADAGGQPGDSHNPDASSQPGADADGPATSGRRKSKSKLPRVRRRMPLTISWLDFTAAREDEGEAATEMPGAFPRCDSTRYAVERGRTGFEGGGHADMMTPSSVLAELTGQARDRMVELTDDELVGVMRATRRLQSWQAALELEAVNELLCRRLSEPERNGPRPDERASAELAAALTLTGQAADEWMTLAARVERFEAVRDALVLGVIDLARAKVFADELGQLDALLANCLATSLMHGAAALTANQLRAQLRRRVMAVDPSAVRKRQAAAQRKARVETWGEPSGNAVLAGRELPPAGALAASRHLTALSQALRKAGAPGELDEVRARVYLALLSGRDPATVLHPAASPSADDQQAQPAPETGATKPDAGAPDDATRGDVADDKTGSDAAGADQAETSRGEAPAIKWPSGLRGSIHLTMPLSSFLGLTSKPGQVVGYGPADAWTCRYLAGQLGRQPDTRYCITVVARDGHPLGHACTTAPPPRANPGSPPPHANPGSPPPHAKPGAPHAKPAAGPPGQRPPADGPDPPAAGPAPPLDTVGDWLGQLQIHWLSQQPDCDHALQTPGYRPSRKLAHLVRLLNPTCTAPGCRRPAQQADLDHIKPYDKGGRTCTCNLHPGCRRHHRMKQQPGWHVQMIRPGVVNWRLPHGRSYTTIAEPYPT